MRHTLRPLLPSSSLADPDRALEVLIRLRDLGVRIALDDFGTGLSSPAYLKVWPLDEVKLDLALLGGIVASLADDAPQPTDPRYFAPPP